MAYFAGESAGASYSIIPIFVGDNYDFWEVKMRTLLLSKGLWSIVERGYSEPDDVSQLTDTEKQSLEATKMSDTKALSKIQNGVSSTIFPRIIGANTAKEAWDILQQEFQGGSKKVMAGNYECIIPVDDLPEEESQLLDIQSVFKLPPHITSINPNAFKPNVVSFGPYHYNDAHLQHMEGLKRRSVNRFLKNTDTTLEHLLQSFEPMKQQLMDHYDQLGVEWIVGDCFLSLMIRDGCFMLEILDRSNNSSADDPIFKKSVKSESMLRMIRRDMLLIENQLPLLVLDKLIADNAVVLNKLKHEKDCKKVKEDEMTDAEFIHKTIHQLIGDFLSCGKMKIKNHNVLCLHALDVVRENMIQQPERTTSTVRPIDGLSIDLVESFEKAIYRLLFPPSATVLRNTGVAFKHNGASSCMDITFDTENRVLTLPYIVVNKETKSKFLNLMVFEKFQPHKGQEVCAYIVFMDSLVRSTKDVRFLSKEGIILFEGIKDEEVIAFFRELAGSQIANPDDSLEEVRDSLSDYYFVKRRSCKYVLATCGSFIEEWGHDFGDTYCKTPWAFIGLVAGFIILLLTAMQTFYSGAPFYKN